MFRAEQTEVLVLNIYNSDFFVICGKNNFVENELGSINISDRSMINHKYINISYPSRMNCHHCPRHSIDLVG